MRPQAQNFLPLLRQFPRALGTPAQRTAIREPVNEAALFAGEDDLVAATPAEIPELIRFVEAFQLGPDCFVEYVVVFDELPLLAFALQLVGKSFSNQLLERVFVHFGKNVELLRLSQVKGYEAHSAASLAAAQCAAHEYTVFSSVKCLLAMILA